MDSLFFTALVSFAISEADNASLPDFQQKMMLLLKDLKDKEWETIPWVDSFLEYLEVEQEKLPEIISDFMDMLHAYSFEELIEEACDIRIAFFLESALPLEYAIKTVQCTYTVQWADGSVLDYICKPFGVKAPVEVEDIANVCSVCLDQFVEASIQPGLDHFYQNSSQLLDDSKLEKLISVMHDYVNELPMKDRHGYERLIDRIKHRLLQKLEFEPPSLDGLIYFKGKGGFQ